MNGQRVQRLESDDTSPNLAVLLPSFTAEAQGDAILVAWETAQEVDALGFNLYRADSPDGAQTRLMDPATSPRPGTPIAACAGREATSA